MHGFRREDDERVLAIDPTSRGFGYAVLEGPGFLVDWGTRDFGNATSNRELPHVRELIRHYRPDIVVVEDVTDQDSRRRHRARTLIEAVGAIAAAHGVSIARIARTEVQAMFRDAEATTKRTIAQAIAGHFPELEPRLPPTRKPWMSEDTRMSIFDAVGFALAYFYHRGGSTPLPTRTSSSHAPNQGTHDPRD